jgi:hypothetical protein
MQCISSFFLEPRLWRGNSPKNTYGLQTLFTERSLPPVYEYFVVPIELMDFWMVASGKFTTKRSDNGWIATLSPRKSEIFSGADINYPPYNF